MSTLGWIAAIIGGWYAFWSLASLAAYGFDKLAATRGWRRIRERRLHEIDLLGGWPGGWTGQRLFRHKLRKGAFMRWYWVGVALHVAAWIVIAIVAFRWAGRG